MLFPLLWWLLGNPYHKRSGRLKEGHQTSPNLKLVSSVVHSAFLIPDRVGDSHLFQGPVSFG